MKTWLVHFWEKLRSSYWLVPGVMLLVIIALSYSVLAIDSKFDLTKIRNMQWLTFSTTEGARAVLSTIAASTFSAATLTFSVTMVTLSLTSSQFGPTLLRNFLRDPINQFTLGAFISTFIYCLLTMRGLVVNGDRIPNISISLAVLFALFDAALFILFIHHTTSSIQIDKIAAQIGKQFISDITRFLPDRIKEEQPRVEYNETLLKQIPSTIRSDTSGYLQAVNHQAISSLADTENITIKLLFKPGQFILSGVPLVEIWPSVHLKSHIEKPIRSSFLIGKQQTAEQDLEFTIRQMVQIAARALSPGINDPFTAMICIDYLATGLAMIAGRNLPDPMICNEQGKLLLIQHTPTFQTLCDACFITIRQMCQDNPPVAIYLLESLCQLAAIVQRQEDQQALLLTAKLTYESAIDKCEMDSDQKAITERFKTIQNVLEKNRAGQFD